MTAISELIALARQLHPSGEIGDGMVAQFQALANRAESEQAAAVFAVNQLRDVFPSKAAATVCATCNGKGYWRGGYCPSCDGTVRQA